MELIHTVKHTELPTVKITPADVPHKRLVVIPQAWEIANNHLSQAWVRLSTDGPFVLDLSEILIGENE